MLHRLETLIQKKVPRIALSATLGDIQEVARILRHDSDLKTRIIESDKYRHDLMLQIKGYVNKDSKLGESPTSFEDISEHLFENLRGKSNLIFANSRRNVEYFATSLREKSESKGVPNEFFPHHGSLSKELREDLEKRLQRHSLPTTAVCTSTLELGIDIGSVHSIAQVDVPGSVSSIRQRLGRSGRRLDEASILRVYVDENEINSRSSLYDKLRMHTLQSVAVVELLKQKWYEPPNKGKFNFSTLVQQVLSLLAQFGGFDAKEAWMLLCLTGPFGSITSAQFAQLLRGLAEKQIIKQTHDGTIVLDLKGERIVNHYSFYAAFQTPEEYRLIYNTKLLGTLPVSNPLKENDFIIFAGRRWKIQAIIEEKKEIILVPSTGGFPRFSGTGFLIHKKIRQEMLNLYLAFPVPKYLDQKARDNFIEGKNYFAKQRLDESPIIQSGKDSEVVIWLGDDAIITLVLIFGYFKVSVSNFGNTIQFQNMTKSEAISVISKIIQGEIPSPEELLSNAKNLAREKYDVLIPNQLLVEQFSENSLAVDDAIDWMKNVVYKPN
ncbi:DEAD/DEAH box helicase [Candidatus Bathyarchaeota archaeon]|nr:DEAD/DEAH box helicase [Candidatus Bathyarchaeota archaeon]